MLNTEQTLNPSDSNTPASKLLKIKNTRKPSRSQNMIYVFDTDLRGRHANKSGILAVNRYGAVVGKASGLRGKSWAIPFLDYDGKTPLQWKDVRDFIVEMVNYVDRQHDQDNHILVSVAALGKGSNLFNYASKYMVKNYYGVFHLHKDTINEYLR
jgi:hypothetical protein